MSVLDLVVRQLRERFAVAGEAGRLVIWHDANAEYAEQVDGLDLGDVTVVRVDESTQFAVKERLLSKEPDRRFLVYRTGPLPESAVDDWLADLELAYGVFVADTAWLIATELGGGEALRAVVAAHPEFFRARSRVEALRPLVSPDDTPDQITASMVRVALGADDRSLSAVWRHLLTEHARGATTGIDALGRLGLADFHWSGTRRIYGYDSPEPSVEDFTLWLFGQAWRGFRPEDRGILRDFSVWVNDIRFRDAYRALADHAADELGVDAEIEDMALPDLVDRGVFRQVDSQILRLLADGIAERTVSDADVRDIVGRRSAGPWAPSYLEAYAALRAASDLLTRVDTLDVSMAAPADGVRRYAAEWSAIDRAYRDYWRCAPGTPDAIPESLGRLVEGRYTVDFLSALGVAWQAQVDTLDAWRIPGVPEQREFFRERVVRGFLDHGQKVVVIVSDALRYEVGQELAEHIRRENNYTADIAPMLAAFPSYTQLGMAALLPHGELAFDPAGTGLVTSDGAATSGTDNRTRMLASVEGAAIQSTAFMNLRKEEARERVKAHRVLYVYHNRIDRAGEDILTEGEVPEAVSDAVDDLVALVKRLAGANVSNMIITADHGFLFQHSPLEDSEFVAESPQADAPPKASHRFVLGRRLKRSDSFTTFTSTQLGLTGDIEAQAPNSVLRLRSSGSGSRYVHGGASLQEVVVPMLTVNKSKRTGQRDVRPVAVRPLPSTNRITTAQVTITLYQETPVSDKVQPITLIAGLYAPDGTLISNEATVHFGQTSDQQRDRYQEVQLVLSHQADDYNGQTIELRMDEPRGSTQRRRYPRSLTFTLQRTFTTDFDEW
ncbi:BREX-1 system phosphatase PglZ type A [Schaalia naturae]|jgi:uncharacterized protein (TIGR02687 family)|uniref:BREX-1 system phosphatase PglZ type A n=1 Tax=Schaalia naturae TaxID=635203 RepID=A0ABW2SNT8_9ACTO